MIINHNIAALNTYRQLSSNNATQSKSLEKLSSGYRINRAGDDAAGLAISEKMRGQIRGLDQASRNAQDGISLIQTAEGALNETHSILQRMRELAVQSTNDTNTDEDRASLQSEISQLKQEIDRIGNNTEFNTQKLLDGSQGAATTSADLTGGVAKTISATNTLSVVNATETVNNAIGITFTDGTNSVDLVMKLDEGTYDNVVAFTNEFNNAFQAAIQEVKDAGGVDLTAEAAKFTFKFDVDATTGYIQFRLEAGATALAGAELTVRPDNMDASLKSALGLGAADITVTGDATNIVATNFTNKSGGAGTEVQWDAFTIKIEDGVEQTANQNNQLRMTYNGMSITSYVAEGSYTTEAAAAEAFRDAIVGLDISAAAGTFGAIVANGDAGTIDGTNWAATKAVAVTYGTNQSGTAAATGLIGAIDALTATELRAKGYAGTTDAMKEQLLYDSYKNSDTTLSTAFNADHKLEVNAPVEMSVDESSKAAIAFGMTDVNLDVRNAGLTIQIGANSAQTMVVDIGDMRTAAVGKQTINSVNYTLADVDVSTKEGADNAIKIIDQAITDVSTQRSKLGAFQNRLEHTINNLGTSSENLSAAESRVRDVDMAKEMMAFTKQNILSQAATAMLAQANQIPQGVLQLLK